MTGFQKFGILEVVVAITGRGVFLACDKLFDGVIAKIGKELEVRRTGEVVFASTVTAVEFMDDRNRTRGMVALLTLEPANAQVEPGDEIWLESRNV
jgi:hypothetical protein